MLTGATKHKLKICAYRPVSDIPQISICVPLLLKIKKALKGNVDQKKLISN